VLKQDQGITYKSLFLKDGEDEEKEEEPEEKPDEEEEGEEGVEKPPKVEKERLPKFKLVPEVVEESEISFFNVPKLGSYLAIKMEYESCLFEEAFDAAVIDFLEVNHRRTEQEKEKLEWAEQ